MEEVRLTSTPVARNSVRIQINLFHLLGITNSMTGASESGNPYALAKSTLKRAHLRSR